MARDVQGSENAGSLPSKPVGGAPNSKAATPHHQTSGLHPLSRKGWKDYPGTVGQEVPEGYPVGNRTKNN